MLDNLGLRILLLVTFVPALLANSTFQTAKPVWPVGLEKEKNLLVGFRSIVDFPAARKTVIFKITGSSLYRFYVNGEFAGHGPARGPHGHYRVDEWNLTRDLKPGPNLIAVEVAGYNIDNYYLLNQPSFLQAEITVGGVVAASTAGSGRPFEGIILPERIQKVQRYSFQRTFTEMYRLAPDYDRWRTDPAAEYQTVELSAQETKKHLRRGVPYPRFEVRPPLRLISGGRLAHGFSPPSLWKDRSLTQVAPVTGGFAENELPEIPSIDLQKIESKAGEIKPGDWMEMKPLLLSRDSYRILDFGTNLTGFIGLEIEARQKSRLFLTFDEILSAGDVDFKRLNCANYVSLELESGSYRFESIEPYTLRFLKLMQLEGESAIGKVYLREYANPDVWESSFSASDERLNRLFSAGRETFRQNAVDIFMDCPSRERAGWLCDSFFAARVALQLSGDTRVETNFFENYRLPESFPNLTAGMLPMCYPAEHPNGRFIPNWALWFVLELEEYVERSGDVDTLNALKPRVLKLFDYFEPFRNQDGLLEGLESWVFIEWSKANDFVQDVNYPSNMLFAAALDAAGRLYNLPDFAQEAARLRKSIRRLSFDGQFFVDNAVRRNGIIENTRNRSEVCQYFAFFFKIATRETHPGLYRILRDDFGPRRIELGKYPEIHAANAFVGNVIRMELLSRWGLSQQLLDESVEYFLYMAERTGTLWENITDDASCNHGFASHIVHILYRDVLGLYRFDRTSRKIHVRLQKLDIDWSAGRIPWTEGPVVLRWRKEGGELKYRLDLPDGYEAIVENQSGLQLVEE